MTLASDRPAARGRFLAADNYAQGAVTCVASESDMPLIAPGSLDDEQYWAVVNYLVKANGIEPPSQGINAANAGAIKLHR